MIEVMLKISPQLNLDKVCYKDINMSSISAQKQKIVKLNVKDKKLTRLFSYSDLSAKDSLFLNFVYQQRQQLFFKYSIVVTLFTALAVRQTFFKLNKGIVANTATAAVVLAGHFFWLDVVNRRFNKLVDPYFQKYGIK